MKPYLRVTLAYAVFGVVWIVVSDHVLGLLADSKEEMARMQLLKGWLFVALSALLVFTISRRAFERHQRTQREKLEVFHKTVEGSYHILLNYLNQMQLVTMEAEQCGEFDQDVVRLATKASTEATTELMKLRDVRTVTVEHIDSVIYERLRNAK